MSKAEANVLVIWGRHWCSHMWIGDQHDKRDELINHVNKELASIGFKLGRGWQSYDPVIRRAGARPSSYAQIAGWAQSQPDQGRALAQQFLDWASGDEVGLLHLPKELRDLAIITHLAEVGRGYVSALENSRYPLLRDIAGGQRNWSDYRAYAPALKYAEDSAMDWAS